jgi:preprotein translocase subunit SecA
MVKRSDEVEHFASLKSMIMDLIEAEIEHVVSYHTNLEQDESQWNLEEIYETMRTDFSIFPSRKNSRCLIWERATVVENCMM